MMLGISRCTSRGERVANQPTTPILYRGVHVGEGMAQTEQAKRSDVPVLLFTAGAYK
jgi:hypothetical protein